jgi:hypothetical protein
LAQLEDALGGEPAGRIFGLVETLDLPRRLRDVRVPEDDLESIASEFGDREADALAILRTPTRVAFSAPPGGIVRAASSLVVAG